MLRVVVFLAAILAVQSQTTTVSRCTWHSGGALPINVYIENCETPPCLLPQLQDVVVNIIFKAPRTLERMTTLATAFLSAVIIPIPIPYDLGENAVTCNFLKNTYCPVHEGEVVVYELRMFIESFFPVGTNANIEFRIVDPSNNSALMCIRVPIRIMPPVETRTNSTMVGGL